jgi:hypothetical protein
MSSGGLKDRVDGNWSNILDVIRVTRLRDIQSEDGNGLIPEK